MRVFLTGSTGSIGSAVLTELLIGGHQVLALARSDAAEEKLRSLGVDVLRGSIEDLETLKRGARESDGVIHCAFSHDFSDLAASLEKERVVVEAIGTALEGTNRPFIFTTGTLLVSNIGKVATEEDLVPETDSILSMRGTNEKVAIALASKGVRSSVIRIATTVHGKGDQAFIPMLIDVARKKGVSAYIGDGTNRWPSAHRLDIARLYRLVLAKGRAGAIYHGVCDNLTQTREIAEAIGKQLSVPVVSKSQAEAAEHFGFMAMPMGLDNPVSSKKTQEELGWYPAQPHLLVDIANSYF